MPTQPNETEARELALYATNDGTLYRQQAQPIIRNLAKKTIKSVYDPALALKLWQYLTDNAARQYAREFPGVRFDKPTRELANIEIAASYEDELRDTVAAMRAEA